MTRASRIQDQLQSLNPIHIELENESDNHAGPPGRETHFKLLFVSPVFEGLSRIDRQRKIFDLLKDEMNSGLHALTLRLLTPDEWKAKNHEFQSPQCASGHEKGNSK